MPLAFSGARVKRDDGRPEEVGAKTIDAVEVVGGRTERYICDAEPRIDCHLAPVVGAADILPRILRPCVVTILARTRNRVECPRQLPVANIVRTNVTRRRHVAFTRGAAEND